MSESKETLEVVDLTDAQLEKTKAKPEVEFNAKETFTDEQSVIIAQNMAMDLAKKAFSSLDFSRATGVQAMTGVLDLISKTAQNNIKLRQDSENAGQISGAAQIVANLFTKVISDASSGNRPLENDIDPDHELPEIEDDIQIELVPGEARIGTDNVLDDDLLDDESSEKPKGADVFDS